MLRCPDVLDDANLPGQTVTTMRPRSCGEASNGVLEGIPALSPWEMCRLGGQQSLALPALRVEAPAPV